MTIRRSRTRRRATARQERDSGEIFLIDFSFLLDHLAPAVSVPASFLPGAVAQLGERCVRNAEVRGSIPLSSTKTAVPKITEPPFSFDAHPPAVLALRAALRRPLPNAGRARVGGEREPGPENRKPDPVPEPGTRRPDPVAGTRRPDPVAGTRNPDPVAGNPETGKRLPAEPGSLLVLSDDAGVLACVKGLRSCCARRSLRSRANETCAAVRSLLRFELQRGSPSKDAGPGSRALKTR
jgi:hypothetical protein